MRTVTASSTMEEITAALKRFDAEIIESDGIFTLYIAGRWKTASTCKDALYDEINLLIERENERAEEVARFFEQGKAEGLAREKSKREQISRLIPGATEAVVLDNFGVPLAIVETNVRGGKCVSIAGAVAEDGTMVNVELRKVSRNKTYFVECLPVASTHFDKLGNVFYMI